jgi:cytohesin
LDAHRGVQNNFPLARYAARYWVAHAQFESVSSQVRKAMDCFFDEDQPHFELWRRTCNIDDEDHIKEGTFDLFNTLFTPTPLYYASLCGFHDLVNDLVVKYPQHVNADGGWYLRPLAAALAGHHFQTADLLYHNGADWNVRDKKKRILLHCAAHYADPAVAQKLIEYGADIHAQDVNGEVPLHYASHSERWLYHTHLERPGVARVLLKHGADVNARSKDGSTPLHLASRNGMPEVARVLLEHGANVEAKDDRGRTPLQIASDNQREEMMKLLLEYGAKSHVENV